MADNIDITPGSGKTISTDDVGGFHIQRVKLTDGTDGSAAAIAGDATNGLDVDVTRVPADPFGADADAAVAAGATGSIQAKLRRLTTDLDAVKTAVQVLDNAVAGTEMQVDIVSGTATIAGAVDATIVGGSIDATFAIGTTVAADDVSVTVTAGEAVAARVARKSLTILASPNNTDDIYVGASGAVNAATPAGGFRMQPGASLDLPTTAAVHADAVSGTQALYYVETY